MKKMIFGKKFKRDKNERNALFKGLMTSLILKDRIKTSEAKAKAIKPEVERLVTKAKNMSNGSAKVISSHIYPNAFDRLVNNVAPRFKERSGGYTRIVKLGRRLGDRSNMVILEWVEMAKTVDMVPSEKVKKEIKNPKTESKATKPAKKEVTKKKAKTVKKVK